MDIKKNQKLEEFNTNKLLIVFVLVFIGIFATMYLHRFMDNAATFMVAYKVLTYSTYTTAGLTGIFGLKWFIDCKKKKNNKYQYFSGKNLFFVFGTAAICFAMSYYVSIFTAAKFIYLFLCAIAASYFVLVSLPFNIYLLACSNILNIVLMYVLSQISGGIYLYAAAGMLIVSAMFFLLLQKNIEKNDGSLFGKKIYDQNTSARLNNVNNICLLLIVIATLAVIKFNVPYLSTISFGLYTSIIYVVSITFIGILNSNK